MRDEEVVEQDYNKRSQFWDRIDRIWVDVYFLGEGDGGILRGLYFVFQAVLGVGRGWKEKLNFSVQGQILDFGLGFFVRQFLGGVFGDIWVL